MIIRTTAPPGAAAAADAIERQATGDARAMAAEAGHRRDLMDCLIAALHLMRVRLRRSQVDDLLPLIDDAEAVAARARRAGRLEDLPAGLLAPAPAVVDVNDLLREIAGQLRDWPGLPRLELALADAVPIVFCPRDDLALVLLRILGACAWPGGARTPLRVETVGATLAGRRGQFAPGLYARIVIHGRFASAGPLGAARDPVADEMRRIRHLAAWLDGHVDLVAVPGGRALRLHLPAWSLPGRQPPPFEPDHRRV